MAGVREGEVGIFYVDEDESTTSIDCNTPSGGASASSYGSMKWDNVDSSKSLKSWAAVFSSLLVWCFLLLSPG